ncbi:hypothetical protein D4R42_00130 [bacterium]|jgi:hypothetical protein|nr:MAG: hypothetical protein D4R42_00130 [bacterium]
MKKKLTLNQTWILCLRMWRWIAKNWKPGNSVLYLKNKWLRENGFKDTRTRPIGKCFFCSYSPNTCCNCPGKLVNPIFNCFNDRYCFITKPKEFYQELLRLNRIRKLRKTK